MVESSRSRRFLLVIPAFRESERLPDFLEPLLENIQAANFPGSVLIVDDGSPNEERVTLTAYLNRVSSRFPGLLSWIFLGKNSGKGAAVLSGWSTESDAEWLGFCDADGSVPAEEVVRLMASCVAVGQAVGAVVASRHACGKETVRRSFSRGALSRLFAFWVRVNTGLALRDTQCGCKFVRKALFDSFSERLSEKGFAFDVDLLLRIRECGASVMETRVAWSEKSAGSLKLPGDGLRLFRAVRRLRNRRVA